MHVKVALLLRQERQQHLADGVGMNPAGISRRLSGAVPWTVFELDAVAAYFGTSTSALVTDSPEFLNSIRVPDEREPWSDRHYEQAGLPVIPRRRGGRNLRGESTTVSRQYRWVGADAYELAA